MLDEKDLTIMRLLQANAKATVTEIAKAISLSNAPTHDRIKRLEKKGIIQRYTTRLDRKKLGKGLMVICYVSLKEHNKRAGKKFIESILAMPEVIECYSISGDFDFMLKVVGNDMDTYYDFHVNKLSLAENVGHIQSVFVMGVIKESMIAV